QMYPGKGTASTAAPFLFRVAFLNYWRTPMTMLKLLGAAAVLSTALATPLMAQEVVQEPGATGFNYPNSHYLTGGYGQRTPWNTDRYPRVPYGGYVAVEP